MKTEVLSRFNQPWLPVTAELIFLALFIGVIIYVYHNKNRTLFIEQANLPLVEDQKEETYDRK
jgi:cbb3-type cytochrome oxidase subunit 3